MSRCVVLAVATAAWLVPAAAASAAEVAAAGCTATFVSAETANAVDNGPAELSGGQVTIGNFTPSTFTAGATAPVNPLVRCV